MTTEEAEIGDRRAPGSTGGSSPGLAASMSSRVSGHGRDGASWPRWATVLSLLLVPVAASTAAGVVISADSTTAQPVLTAGFRVYQVAAPMVAALLWMDRRPESRVGPMLLGLGILAWVVAWQASPDPVLHTIGVAAEEPYAILVLAIPLAVPAGRLVQRWDRLILGVMSMLFALSLIGKLLTQPSIRGAGPLAACLPACPPNPFVVAAPNGVTLGIGVVAGMAYLIASILVAGAGGLFPAVWSAYAIGVFVLQVGPQASILLQVLFVGAQVVYPIGFALVLVQADRRAARVERELLAALGAGMAASGWRDRIAAALADPTVRVDALPIASIATATPAMPADPQPRSDRTTIVLADGGGPVARIEADAAVAREPELLAAVGAATLAAVQRDRLERELRSTRTRLVEASDTERRRIGRDLHDSAQQRLIAARIRLAALRDRLRDPDDQQALGSVLEDIGMAVTDLRGTVRGLYPPVLESHGVVEALRWTLRDLPVSVSLMDEGTERHVAAVEAAVYFACLEAIQNASKHAGPAARIRVTVGDQGETVRFRVEDDGAGFDPDTTSPGAGLLGIMDRIAAVGGECGVRSSPGHGTAIEGIIPV